MYHLYKKFDINNCGVNLNSIIKIKSKIQVHTIIIIYLIQMVLSLIFIQWNSIRCNRTHVRGATSSGVRS